MTDTITDPVHLRVKLSPWRSYRRALALRRQKWQEGQLCLFQPEPPTLTAAGVETYEGRPRRS